MALDSDTSPEVQRLMDERYRAMTMSERFELADRLYVEAVGLVEASIRAQHPMANGREQRRMLLERLHGRDYAALACEVVPDG